MTDSKAMTTPMASNMKLLSDASSESVDSMSDIKYLLCCEHIETCSPDGCKACRAIVDYGLKYNAN